MKPGTWEHKGYAASEPISNAWKSIVWPLHNDTAQGNSGLDNAIDVFAQSFQILQLVINK